MVGEGLHEPHAAERVDDGLGREVALVAAQPLLGELAHGAARGTAAAAALAADDGVVEVAAGGWEALEGGGAGGGAEV